MVLSVNVLDSLFTFTGVCHVFAAHSLYICRDFTVLCPYPDYVISFVQIEFKSIFSFIFSFITCINFLLTILSFSCPQSSASLSVDELNVGNTQVIHFSTLSVSVSSINLTAIVFNRHKADEYFLDMTHSHTQNSTVLTQ